MMCLVLEEQTWETFTLEKNPIRLDNIVYSKDYLEVPQRRLISSLH